MAKVLAQNFSIDIGAVVNGAIRAVKTVRRSAQAKREAEFQRAIADGLSYAEQLKLREKWLKEENDSSFPDEEYIASLEKTITETKKLNRFQKYREKYVQTLNELNAGIINERQYLKELETQLQGIDDPELRLEINGDISEAHKAVKNYNDTILKNQVVVAQKDGTVGILKEAISRVKAARADALLSDNEDEVTAYDETLIALDSQLNNVRVEDAITRFQTKSATLGVSPVEKLDFINTQIQGANQEISFRFGDKTYRSAQEFWNLQRDQYLAGNSDILGGNFFEELNVFTDGQIAVDNAKFGYTTKQALDSALNQYNLLAGRPEMAPFLINLENSRTNSMNGITLPSPTSVPISTPTPTPAGEPVKPTPVSAALAPAEAPAQEPAPATPTPGVVPAAPVEPDGTASNPFPGQPTFTPSSGIGTKSVDGRFIFTDKGWQPTPAGAAGAANAPQYTPVSGDMTLSSDGKFIYKEGKGWEPVTAGTPVTKLTIPTAAPVSVPPSTPVNLPTVEPAKITPGAPIAKAAPPNYSPSGGVGSKSEDGRFVYTKAGWQPVLAPVQVSPAKINLANPVTAFNSILGKTKAPVSPAPAKTSTPNQTKAPEDLIESILKKKK